MTNEESLEKAIYDGLSENLCMLMSALADKAGSLGDHRVVEDTTLGSFDDLADELAHLARKRLIRLGVRVEHVDRNHIRCTDVSGNTRVFNMDEAKQRLLSDFLESFDLIFGNAVDTNF